ncbi:MAG: serine/threonine protein kinase [Deltaproteobacteria bacterium]|nr:serine/threonine protein kinase [Deltaproteobacteria bacterium]
MNGKYRLVEKLGEGGMGTVWLAENIAIESEVAVKVLHTMFTQDPSAVTRFRNEARAAAKIGHPNIVRVFDFGDAEQGEPYMVMERMKGESLAARLERESALAPREAAELLLPVLRALEAAHHLGIVHRDLKPENIFLAVEGDAVVPKVLDFGVSKFLGDDAERVRMTRTGALIGTPAYMSPEQARGMDDIDHRTDLWACGVILFELVSGALPYDATNYNAMLIAIATTPPPDLRERVPSLDPALAEIVARALTQDRAARVGTAHAFLSALQHWLRGEPVTYSQPPRVTAPSKPVALTPERATPVGFESADTMLESDLRAKRRSLLGAVSLVAAVAALTVGAAWVLKGRSPPPPIPTTAVPSLRLLDVRHLPPGAEVLVDDEVVTLPARVNAHPHQVTVRVAGYLPWVSTMRDGADPVMLSWQGTLAPAEAPAEAPAGAPQTPPPQVQANPSGGPSRPPGRPPRTPPQASQTTAHAPPATPPPPARPPPTPNRNTLLVTDPNAIH